MKATRITARRVTNQVSFHASRSSFMSLVDTSSSGLRASHGIRGGFQLEALENGKSFQQDFLESHRKVKEIMTAASSILNIAR